MVQTREVLKPGTRITQSIDLVRVVGSGSMGTVWVARHLVLGNEVAVKFLEHVSQKDAHERFFREGKAVAKIRSPHVIQVFDCGSYEDVPFMVMELLEGEDLRARLERCRILSLDKTASIVSQVAKALHAAHSLGIVHRDISAGNVFAADVGGEQLIKVLDFGLAKSHDDLNGQLTRSGVVLGTPYFTSPEQMADPSAVGPSTDLWALGALAYRCLTGSFPFEGRSLLALTVAVEKGVFVPASVLQPDLPDAIDAWFSRSFQRDPDKRFASAPEMAHALAILADSEPAAASSAASGPRPLSQTFEETSTSRARSANRPRPHDHVRSKMVVPVTILVAVLLLLMVGITKRKSSAELTVSAPPSGAVIQPTISQALENSSAQLSPFASRAQFDSPDAATPSASTNRTVPMAGGRAAARHPDKNERQPSAETTSEPRRKYYGF